MKTSDPSIDEEHPASVAEAGEGLKQVRGSYKAVQRIDDFGYYHTCLYVGLTLFDGAAIRNGSVQGRADKDKLTAVLQSMQGLKHKPTRLADSVSNM